VKAGNEETTFGGVISWPCELQAVLPAMQSDSANLHQADRGCDLVIVMMMMMLTINPYYDTFLTH